MLSLEVISSQYYNNLSKINDLGMTIIKSQESIISDYGYNYIAGLYPNEIIKYLAGELLTLDDQLMIIQQLSHDQLIFYGNPNALNYPTLNYYTLNYHTLNFDALNTHNDDILSVVHIYSKNVSISALIVHVLQKIKSLYDIVTDPN